MSSTEQSGFDPKLSSDARDSTYERIEPDPEQNPPSGHRVEQTLGTPSGDAPAPTTKKASSSSSASSSS